MTTQTPDERQWKVVWTIDEWAPTPEEAARKARLAQIRPNTLATVFEVREHVEPGSAAERRLVSYRIDVNELPSIDQAFVCPECGSPIRKFYRPNASDPGDVDPAADCTNPQCDWGY